MKNHHLALVVGGFTALALVSAISLQRDVPTVEQTSMLHASATDLPVGTAPRLDLVSYYPPNSNTDPVTMNFHQLEVGRSIYLMGISSDTTEVKLWGVKKDQLKCSRVGPRPDGSEDNVRWKCTALKSLISQGNSELFYTEAGNDTNRSNSVVIQVEPASGNPIPKGWKPAAITLTPDLAPNGDGVIPMTAGDSVNIIQSVVPGDEINSGWQTVFDPSIFNCTRYPDFDSNQLRCTALKAGKSSVYVSHYLIFPDNKGKTVYSNKLRFSIAKPKPIYNAANCVMEVPNGIKPNQKFQAKVTLTNTGNASWVVNKQGLSTQNPAMNKVWGRQIIHLTKDVAPGQAYTFVFDAKAPTAPGMYSFDWQMRSASEWFGEVCLRQIPVGQVVSSSSSSVSSSSSSSRSSSSSSSSSVANNVKLYVGMNTMASSDVLVKNEKNVNLLRFESLTQGGPVTIHKAVFVAKAGSIQNGQNYSLWADTNGDAIVDTITQNNGTVNVASNSVTFNFAYEVGVNSNTVFEVHADIAANFIGNELQLTLKTNEVDYIGADSDYPNNVHLNGISTNGLCPSFCDIYVYTADTTKFTLVNQGDLYITKSDTPIRSRQLLGGTLGDEILRIELHADNEDIDVTHLQFTSSGSNASSITQLELYKVGQTVPFATATIAGCTNKPKITTDSTGNPVTTFCSNTQSQQLVIPEGTDAEILVRPRMKADTSGGVSGQKIALFIGSGLGAANATVEAEGVSSSNPLVMSDSDSLAEGEIFIGRAYPGANMNIFGNANVSVHSKITSITNANSDPNGTAIPEGMNRQIAKFQFTAATHANSNNGSNDATLSDIAFKVVSTNMTMSGSAFRLYNEADVTKTITCNTYAINGAPLTGAVSGTFYVTCPNIATSTVNARINQGTSMTAVLQANILQTQIGGAVSSLQVSLNAFESIARSTFGIGGNNSNLRWIDADGVITAADPSFVWVEYPTTSVSSTTYISG